MDNNTSPFVEQRRGFAGGQLPARVSDRTFNLIVSGLLFLGFCAMGLETRIASSVGFQLWLYQASPLMVFAPFIASIAGMVIMGMAQRSESVGMSLTGYVLFALSFGFSAAMVVAQYDLPTVQNAFFVTAGITVVFGAAGVALPNLFKNLGGALMTALVALIVAQLIMFFLPINQTWLDLATVVVFSGFIGYDMYRATVCEPTIPNAVLAASELYMDIVNIFLHLLRLLSVLDRD